MTEREDTIERIERVLGQTHKESITVTIPRLTAERAVSMLKEQEAIHWTSVNDGLPTYAELKDDCVLVLLDDGAICSTGFDECIENESIFGEWRQNFDPVTLGATDSYWMPLEGVTHWMPIPKQMQKGR